MQLERRLFLLRIGGVVAAGTIAGCIGDDEIDPGDGTTPTPEVTPDPRPTPSPTPEEDDGEVPDFPEGLSSDELDVSILEAAVARIVSDDAYHWRVIGQALEKDELLESFAVEQRGDTTDRVGVEVHGRRVDSTIDDPLDGSDRTKVFVDGEAGFEVENDSVGPAWRGFESLVSFTLEDGLPEVARVVSEIQWSSPSWDAHRDRFILEGVDFGETSDPEVTEATLEVTADGLATRLAGTYLENDATVEVDLSFRPIDGVDEPAWFASATETGRPPMLRDIDDDAVGGIRLFDAIAYIEDGRSFIWIIVENNREDAVEDVEVAIELFDEDGELVDRSVESTGRLDSLDYTTIELEYDAFGEAEAFDIAVVDVEFEEGD